MPGWTVSACDTVYLRRILRGAEHYSWQLGAFGSELGALACFFEKPWEQPIAELSESTQTWLLNEVAIVLGAVNRVGEALEPMRRVLSRDVRLESWEEATISAGNLSELEVTLGELSAPPWTMASGPWSLLIARARTFGQ